ncbi:LysR family transcriptional regulator [Novosphingobium malaysiense]|uniref:LysR family transcriptional regulator n=1 Tax=Novosphingobium malaysiense TaxID=1348853 RepID=UPI00069126A6|nr:LysR family transcriptional regulator [Novosphingobium malaysiense]
MHFKGLDLNLLVVLDALLEEVSVSKAAQRLHVSQPAISAALAKLRWHTGDELLEKIGRTVRLTPRAKEMIKPLKEILFQIESTVKGQSEINPQTLSRDFSISMTTYCAQILLPSMIDRLQAIAPNVTCQVEDIAFDSVTRIKGGALDLCVTFLQTKLLNPRETLDELSYVPLFSDHWVLVSSKTNPKVKQGMNFDAFRALPYIEVRPGGVPSLVERTLDQLTNRPRPVVSVPSFSLAIRSVIDTDCVTIVPSRIIDRHTRPHLNVVDAPFAIPEIDECLVWHSRNDEEPGHRWFRSLLVDCVTEIINVGALADRCPDKEGEKTASELDTEPG